MSKNENWMCKNKLPKTIGTMFCPANNWIFLIKNLIYCSNWTLLVDFVYFFVFFCAKITYFQQQFFSETKRGISANSPILVTWKASWEQVPDSLVILEGSLKLAPNFQKFWEIERSHLISRNSREFLWNIYQEFPRKILIN